VGSLCDVVDVARFVAVGFVGFVAVDVDVDVDVVGVVVVNWPACLLSPQHHLLEGACLGAGLAV
jgi:hypothetical protein